MPQVGQREIDHSCQVFRGKTIHLGKGGWDICAESSEGGQNGLHLVTQNLEVGPKGTLLQLLKRVLGVNLRQLRRMSVKNDEAIQLLASHFDIDGGELGTRVEAIETTDDRQPYSTHGMETANSSEAEQWDLRVSVRSPNGRSDKDAGEWKRDRRGDC